MANAGQATKTHARLKTTRDTGSQQIATALETVTKNMIGIQNAGYPWVENLPITFTQYNIEVSCKIFQISVKSRTGRKRDLREVRLREKKRKGSEMK